MIKRDGGAYHALCDRCSEDVELGAETFAEAINEKNAMGWKWMPNGDGEAYDVCQACQDAAQESRT